MNTEAATALAAPQGSDNQTVILWVVGVLVFALTTVVAALWRKMGENAAECRAENKAARDEAAAVRTQNERLYQQAIEATAERERALAAVVERNTAAWNAHAETIKTHFGSDYYRAIREQRTKADDAAGNRPH